MPKPEDLFNQPFVISRQRRDATVVIRGFVYQVNTTILKWIELEPDQWLELEAGEDIDALQKAVANQDQFDRLFEAVKCRERNLTLRSPEALSALACFQEHRQSNASLRLGFRYITNSPVGAENPAITEVGTPGIHLWERIRTGLVSGKAKSTLVSALRSFLKGSPRPADLAPETWESFQRFLKRCTIPELNRFVDAFEWGTEQASPDDLEGKVRYALMTSGKVNATEHADIAFEHLFHFVFDLLSKRPAKILTPTLLVDELKKLDQAEMGRSILSNLRGIETTLQTRFDRLEEHIAPLQSDMQGVKATVARIESAVTSLRESRYDRPGDPREVDGPCSQYLPTPQVIAAGNSGYPISMPLPSIVSSALLAQNEELAAVVVAQTKGQINAIRDAARKGLRGQALREIAAQRANRVAWQVLPCERRAELLRLEASILLNSEDGADRARQILDEAAKLAPAEDDSRLRACIAFSEHDPQTAISLMEGKEQPESRNLLAIFLFLTGRYQEGWQALPPLGSDVAVRAETLRIRAQGLLQRRDLPGARADIDLALAAEPAWPGLEFVSASISYYEALSPAAIPSRLQEWPEPSSSVFRLNTSQARAKLREAAAIFARLAQLPDSSVEERRLMELWHFACLTGDVSRREEARTYATNVLAADPGQYRLVPWILAQRYEGLDLTATEHALAAAATAGRGNVFRVIALVMLHLESSNTAEALSTLDRTQRQFLPLNKNAWHHWRAMVLLIGGDIAAATMELEKFDAAEEADPLWSEIQRFESRKSGDWDPYEAALRARLASTKSAEALLEYCEFAAHRRNWSAVAALRVELVERIGTPDALCLAAIATFNAGQPRECLKLLESGADFFADESRGEELRRVSIACNKALGQMITARQQAEHLSKMAATTGNLLLLAQLQLDTGDPKALALNARQLAQRQDLSSDQALRIAMLVRQEDSQLARSLWRRAVASDLPDDAVGAALTLGYRLGLDREVRPLLARMNDLAEQGKGGIERKTLPDLIELIKTHRENVDWFNGLYLRGEMAIHLIPTRIRTQLVALYHDGPACREKDPEKPGPALFAIHGGRPWMNGFPREVPAWRLNLDITSLLLAHHLDILPKVERAFGVLRVAPSIFAALGSMQESLLATQVTQIDAAHEVLACIDDGSLSVLDENGPDEPADLIANGGADWAALYELSRQTGGRLVDFLPKITTDPTTVMPSDAEARLVNCRAVIEALRQHGALSADEYASSLSDLGFEGQQPPAGAPIDRDTVLYFQSTMARVLVNARLLRPACRTFRLQMLREDANELKAVVTSHERAKELSEWLSVLIQHIRQRLEEKKYEFMAIGPTPDAASDMWDTSFDVKGLSELLTFAPEPVDRIWVDDRWVNAYLRRDAVPIVSIVDILKALVAAREATESEYYRLLYRLRAAKCAFIPLESGEILHHLVQAPVTSYALSETPEMGTLRRYWAENLLRGACLQRPGASAANAGGEMPFLLASANAVRDALAGLWEAKLSQTDEEREARAEWILNALYTDHLGVRTAAELVPGGINEHELVGTTLGNLVGAGLEMRLEGRCTSQALRDYLYWLYHRVLHYAFERDGRVLQSAGAFIRMTLRALWQGVPEGQKPRAGRLIQFLLEVLPEELLGVVRADAEFAAELSIETVPVVQVGPLRFSKKEYFEAVREAVNGRGGRARVWRSADEVEFESTADGIALKPPAGGTINVADPLLMLLSDQVSQRESALNSHCEWFDCGSDERAEATGIILADEDPFARVEKAHGWRERSAAVFYANLSRKLSEQEGLVPDDIRPPSAEALLRHYRLSADPSRGSFLNQIASGCEQITEEFGIAQSFIRYAGLPIPLPRVFLSYIDALSESERRALVKRLLRTAGSPLSTIHFVRLLAHLADSPYSRYWRLATRAISALLRPDAIEQFSAFRNLLQWTDSAFEIWPQTKTWSATERLAMVWAHTHRVFSTFNYLGVPAEWIADRFGRPDFGLCYELFDYSTACRRDVVHPKRFSREALLLTGLGYATGENGAEWWGSAIRGPLLDLVHPVADGETGLNLGLLRDSSLAGDLLGSFLAGDRSHIPCAILKDDGADVLLLANVKKLGAEALQAAQTGNSIVGWNGIYLVFGDSLVGDGQRELMVSAILNIDLAPLADNLVACGRLLHAASMQAAALRSISAMEHLSAQVAKVAGLLRERSCDGRKLNDDERQFLSALFQVAINLSWGAEDGEARASEFTRQFARIADAFPKSVAVSRRLLNRIWPCEANLSKLLWPLLIRSRATEA